jgi:phospholipase D1/2
MPLKRRARVVSVVRVAALPVIIAGAAYGAWRLGYFDLEHRRHLASVVGDFHSRRWSAPLFVVLWAGVVSLCMPATFASVLGGAVFGTAVGALLNWIGALGATLLGHTIARRLIKNSLIRLFGEHRLLRLLRERADMLALLRLRLVPVAPFALLDYLAGLAGVPALRLLVATAIGVIPSVVAYAYVGSAIMASARNANHSAHAALVIAGIATVAMMLLSAAPTIFGWMRE